MQSLPDVLINVFIYEATGKLKYILWSLPVVVYDKEKGVQWKPRNTARHLWQTSCGCPRGKVRVVRTEDEELQSIPAQMHRTQAKTALEAQGCRSRLCAAAAGDAAWVWLVITEGLR